MSIKVTVCGRVHLGPVKPGADVCQGCGEMLTRDEKITYWNMRVQVNDMMIAAHRKLNEYLRRA